MITDKNRLIRIN